MKHFLAVNDLRIHFLLLGALSLPIQVLVCHSRTGMGAPESAVDSNPVNDITQSYAQIEPSPEAMRSRMVDIACHQFRRTVAEEFYNNLRFINICRSTAFVRRVML